MSGNPDHGHGEHLVTPAIARSSLSIVISDPRLPDNPIVYANYGFEALTQYSPDYAIGRNCRFLQGDETATADIDRLRQVVANRQEDTIRIRNYRADGSAFINEILLSPIEDESGEVEAFLAVQREVAEQEDGNAAGTGGGKRPAHDTPSNVMLSELQHRVKNHLSMVVSLIRTYSRRDITRKSFDALAHRIESLALLYDEMIKPGEPGEHHGSWINGGTYLSRVANVLSGISGNASVRMVANCEPVQISVDAAGRLGLLLTEFLTNAFEHAFVDGEGGTITVRFEKVEGERVQLIVEDDGAGMPAGSKWPYRSRSVSQQRDLAEKEKGVLDTTSGNSHSGLGGSVVLGLTKSLKADLDVQSGPTGTRITVELSTTGAADTNGQ
ncbi:MAG: PAS domain-containing protein [Henriciella sp.]|uniref:PAS domain-containing protein n=1 Tax=Henriciella sp. TaxID=1968823 RepID=UPI003C78241F